LYIYTKQLIAGLYILSGYFYTGFYKKRDRTLPDEVVQQNYKEVQDNLLRYRSAFSNHFIEIDNNEDKPPIQATQSKMLRIVQEPVKNPIGKKWIETALKLKSLK